MPTKTYQLLFRLMLVAVTVTICWLAFSQPSAKLPSLGFDKLNHVVAFATLALLFDYSFPNKTRALCISLLAFGAFIELVQGVMTYRSISGWDLVADMVGIASYLIIQPLRAKLHG